jgi:NAD(P) transhydrogenase subunit alpha
VSVLASTLTTNLAILVLAGFVGFIVISKIPNTLHTPLMSGTNAIHGIVLVGALLLLGLPSVGVIKLDALSEALLVIAVAFGTINVVGGFLVTDRMLEMFKRKPERPLQEAPRSAEGAGVARPADGAQGAEGAKAAEEAQAGEGAQAGAAQERA